MSESIEAARAVNDLLHLSEKDSGALLEVIQDYFDPSFSDSGMLLQAYNNKNNYKNKYIDFFNSKMTWMRIMMIMIVVRNVFNLMLVMMKMKRHMMKITAPLMKLSKTF